MFKILHEIASNVHFPAACKMYTKIQKSPHGLLLQSEARTDETSSGLWCLHLSWTVSEGHTSISNLSNDRTSPVVTFFSFLFSWCQLLFFLL